METSNGRRFGILHVIGVGTFSLSLKTTNRGMHSTCIPRLFCLELGGGLVLAADVDIDMNRAH